MVLKLYFMYAPHRGAIFLSLRNIQVPAFVMEILRTALRVPFSDRSLPAS
jgi:hypothetical protein